MLTHNKMIRFIQLKFGSSEHNEILKLLEPGTNTFNKELLKAYLMNQKLQGKYNGIVPEPSESDNFVLLVTDYTEFTQNNKKYISDISTKKVERTILPLLDANFFSQKNSNDQNNSARILKGTISTVYSNLAKFSILLMMVVLLYIGIRIIISTTSESQAKYKELLVGWFIGLCLIFFMHVIMSFISQFNELIVNTLGSSNVDEYYITVSDLDNDGWKNILNSSNSKIKYFVAEKLDYNLTFSDLKEFEINGNGETITNKWEKQGENNSTVKVNARLYKKDADYILYKCNIIEYMRTCISVDSDYVEELKHQSDGSVKINTDASSSDEEDDNDEKNMGTVFFGYAVLYIMLVIETVTFVVKYLKRVIYLAFLTMIAPLIALMYPMDKVGDGKAQTFNMWFKEYLFNSLLQPLHLLLYTIFIVGAEDLVHSHCIYAIGFYAFMLFAEGFFKKMFGFDKANMPKGLGSPLAAGMSMKMFDAITGLGPPGSPGSKKGGNSDSTSGGKIKRAKAKFGTDDPGMPLSSGGPGIPLGSGDSGMPSSSGGSKMPFGSGGSKMPSSSGGIKSGISSAFGIGRHAINRKKSNIVRAITGGKTGNFTNALKGHKLDIAKTVGRTGLKIANRAAGTAAGTLLGLTSGVIGAAVTGDSSYLTKGVTTGAATGFNRSKNVESWIARENEENKKMYASENVAYAAQMSKDQFMKDNYKYFDSLPDSKRQNLLETLETFTPYMDFKDTSQLEAIDAIYQENKGDMSLEDIYNSSQDAKTWGDLTDSSRRSDYEKYLANEERKNIEAKDVTYTKDELDKEIEAQRNAEEERIRSKYEPKIKMKYDIKSDSEAKKLEIAMNKALSDMSKIDFKERAEGEIRNRKIDEISMERARQKSKMTQSYQNKMK